MSTRRPPRSSNRTGSNRRTSSRRKGLTTERLVEVTFEPDRNCCVAAGRWYGALTGTYVDTPADLDINHLVPLKNTHDSDGWAWRSARKEDYANYLGDPDHLIAVTQTANRSKGAKGPEEWGTPPRRSQNLRRSSPFTSRARKRRQPVRQGFRGAWAWEEGFRKPWCLALGMETVMGSCVSGDTCKLTWITECVNGSDHSLGNAVIANH